MNQNYYCLPHQGGNPKPARLTKRQLKKIQGKGAVPAHGGPGREAARAAAHRERLNNYGNPRGEGKLVQNRLGAYVDASGKGCFGGDPLRSRTSVFRKKSEALRKEYAFLRRKHGIR